MFDTLTSHMDNTTIDKVMNLVGTSRLTKWPAMRIYREMESRSGLLYRLTQGMLKFQQLNKFKNLDDEIRFFSYFNALVNMQRYVEECHGQLDINNSIDKAPYGDPSYARYPAQDDSIFLHRVDCCTPLFAHWKKYMEDFPSTLLEKMYSPYVRLPEGYFDKAAKMLMKMTYKSRKASIAARLQWELKVRHEQGWYLVFDTLTLSNDCRREFENTQHALRDYCRSIGRAILLAEGRGSLESTQDCYSYFAVPEYGGENGRLHFHVVHFCRTLPHGSVDPNIGCKRRNRRQIQSFKGKWMYGHSMPIALRYHNDAFTKRGWLWPLDDKGNAIPSKPVAAIGFYVTKYVSKNLDMLQSDHARNIPKSRNADFIEPPSQVDSVDLSFVKPVPSGVPKWQITTPLTAKQRQTYKVRMSRHLGQTSIRMQDLSLNAVCELATLHYKVTPYSLILKRMAKKELVERMRICSLGEIQASGFQAPNLLRSLRCMTRNTTEYNQPNFTNTTIQLLSAEDISDETRRFLLCNQYDTASVKAKSIGSRSFGRPK